jgi:hypothetical protein
LRRQKYPPVLGLTAFELGAEGMLAREPFAHYQRPGSRNQALFPDCPYNFLMNEPLDALLQILTCVILPNLKTVQVSQAEQIAANDRLENSIEELRLHLESQFAHLSAQLTACRAELAAAQAAFKAVHTQNGTLEPDCTTIIH